MATEVLNTEFVMMKDTVWKLSSRVLLLEGFIKQQFGNVFWQFCEDQVKGVDETPEENEEDEEEANEVLETKPTLPMPPMIPILTKKATSATPPPSATLPPPSSQQSTPNNNHRKANIPPPPPLSLMRASLSSSSNNNYHHHQAPKARNFLPKSLTTKNNSPKLPASITITPTSSVHSSNKMGGNNGRITPQGVSILKEKISDNSFSQEQQQHQTTRVKLEAAKGGGGLQQRRSPAASAVATPPPPLPPALIMSRQGRISSSSNISNNNNNNSSNRIIPSHSQHHQQFQQQLHHQQQQQHLYGDREEEEEEYGGGGGLESGEYYSGEGEEELSEEDSEMYGDGGYLAAELVSATLCPPEDGDIGQEDDEDGLIMDGGEGGSHHKKIRLSLGAASSSSSSYMNGGSNNGGGSRQMRPNPCHARCQNRCHDIWTDGDRMGVFQTYWAIPNEEERREFVASRIERVDMATKRTEFSNFRTCTFKYYLPHPENAWVQVCKNFFLATIDEKRSYIEKIAQSVKGDAGEKVSTKNIPFRRRNQMQRSVEDNYAGWMQGLGLDPSLLDPNDPNDPEGSGVGVGGGINMGGYDQDQIGQEDQEDDVDDNEGGMEIMEDEASLQD